VRLLINLLPSLTKRFVEISISANLSSYMFYYLYVSNSDMGLNSKHGNPIELKSSLWPHVKFYLHMDSFA
jgi:hypothetical protein